MRDAIQTIVQKAERAGWPIGDSDFQEYSSLVDTVRAMNAQISQLTYNHCWLGSSYLNSRWRIAFFFLADMPKFSLSIQYIC